MVAPNVSLSQIFAYGENSNDPGFSKENLHQISDTFSWGAGAHLFKLGASANFIHTYYRAAITFGGQYSYTSAVIGSYANAGAFAAATGCPSAEVIFCAWLFDLDRANAGDGRTGTHWTSYAQFTDHLYPPNLNGQAPATIVPYDPNPGGDDFLSPVLRRFPAGHLEIAPQSNSQF
jgi:hypothetical protein